jgi:hypothetical protein
MRFPHFGQEGIVIVSSIVILPAKSGTRETTRQSTADAETHGKRMRAYLAVASVRLECFLGDNCCRGLTVCAYILIRIILAVLGE